MDTHKNARLTPHCRALLVDRVVKGRARAQVARELGVSLRTVSKWLQRYQAEAIDGLLDRSSRPRRWPTATAAAVAYYAGLGLIIREVRTDNGGGCHSREFAGACRDLGLKHRYTRPYTPRANGKAERFIQTALREWAYARAYARSQQRIADLPRFQHASGERFFK